MRGLTLPERELLFYSILFWFFFFFRNYFYLHRDTCSGHHLSQASMKTYLPYRAEGDRAAVACFPDMGGSCHLNLCMACPQGLQICGADLCWLRNWGEESLGANSWGQANLIADQGVLKRAELLKTHAPPEVRRATQGARPHLSSLSTCHRISWNYNFKCN